jgi:serine/threonine protein kinase
MVLLLVLNLCVATDRVTLESRYCSQLPFSNGHGSESVGFNVLYALYCHLSHPENARVVPRLRSHVAQFGKAASRLFKLVCEGIFDMRLYSHGQEILAKGAFGTVMSVKSPVNLTDGVPDSDRSVSHGDSSLTVKLIPHEVSAQDRCVTFDVFSEVSALETLAHSPYVCRLYDYGISGGKFWLVMERCRSSLKAWRTEQMPAKPSDKDIMLYLHVFSKILEGVQTLHHEGIAHFDLKCDNIFIREREGPEPKDARFHVPFHVCIGDFGEAQIGSSRTEDNESDVDDDESDRRILQGRGTEAIQSPEMLLIGAKNRKDAAGYDRRKRVTVGCASDVWSLGYVTHLPRLVLTHRNA